MKVLYYVGVLNSGGFIDELSCDLDRDTLGGVLVGHMRRFERAGAVDVELMASGWSMEVYWSSESRRVACELDGDMLKGALAAVSSSPLGLYSLYAHVSESRSAPHPIDAALQ
jgi:hypothetical protein